ncbi:MAG TPA: tetratricopeptide repeat protein, partial [Pyrinomonadaceae bacterium]|nr:tetratricopeptide repeat protein [Pyrinomonadaceae bacterium]
MRHFFLPALLLLLTSPIHAWSNQTLEPGKTIEGSISGGETHSYTFTLAPGTYTIFAVDQKGINLSVFIYAPDGQPVRSADLRNPGLTESLAFISESNAAYRIDVLSPHKSSRSGKYALTFAEPRQPTDDDKTRVEAEKLVETSMQLLLKQTVASREEAVEKTERSATYWRKINQKSNEAYALYLMAYTLNRLGRYPKAEEAAQKGLVVAKQANDPEMQAFMFDEIGSSYNGLGERKKALGFFIDALQLRTGKDQVAL